MRRVLHALVVLVLASCGGAPPVARRAASWPRLDFVRRHEVMTFTVLPTMARRFQEEDGAPAPAMTCETCHGDGALDARYAMPRGLPPLPSDAATRVETDPRRARRVRFMKETVTPLMVRLIDADDVTCFTCHPRAEAP